jgi:hypothetical protein
VPRPKKPPGTAVDRRNGQRSELAVVAGQVTRFDPPEGLTAAAVQAWEDFWVDRPALLLTPSAKVVLLRWVDALDRYLRCSAEADREPLVAGSNDQPRPNPLYRVAEQARATVDACERQLGVGGLNASSLGLAAISERRSLADMNARYGGAGDGRGAAEEPDPRLRIIDG